MFTLGGTLATTLLAMAPGIHAGENPFQLTPVDTSRQLLADANAETTDDSAKLQEGKCGADKIKAAKAQEASCGANKKTSTETPKLPEAKCGAAGKK